MQTASPSQTAIALRLFIICLFDQNILGLQLLALEFFSSAVACSHIVISCLSGVKKTVNSSECLQSGNTLLMLGMVNDTNSVTLGGTSKDQEQMEYKIECINISRDSENLFGHDGQKTLASTQ